MRIPKWSFGAVSLFALVAAGAAPARAQFFDDLVLHTVTPCRLWDTRNTTPISAGATRGFNVFGSNLSSQGGNSSGCGLPSTAPATTIAVAINFVATNSAGAGTLKGWAGDISEPTNASIVNYSPATFAIANAAIVAVRTTGTLGNGSDVILRANGAQTDTVGDVVGYFTKSERHATENSTSPNLFGGSPSNSVDLGNNVVGATISGGGASGTPNTVTANFGTVGGGRLNNAGGSNSNTEGLFSTVGGGESNGAAANHATVGGGVQNLASGDDATVGGGFANQAVGNFATIPGGSSNNAGGSNAFAAGTQANASNFGSMLFSDAAGFTFSSKHDNEFAVRATGGARFVTAINGSGTTTAGCSIDTAGNVICTGSFFNVSDRMAKANVNPVDGEYILRRLAVIPIQSWTYRADPNSTRHIGPMAQDFYAAFDVGQDDKHIATVDADGVALAAIQALYKQLQQKEAEIRELKSRLDGMQSVVDRVERLEKQLPVRSVSAKDLPH
jgi:hypothetical protein